jgi:hypothetical protein
VINWSISLFLFAFCRAFITKGAQSPIVLGQVLLLIFMDWVWVHVQQIQFLLGCTEFSSVYMTLKTSDRASFQCMLQCFNSYRDPSSCSLRNHQCFHNQYPLFLSCIANTILHTAEFPFQRIHSVFIWSSRVCFFLCICMKKKAGSVTLFPRSVSGIPSPPPQPHLLYQFHAT